MGIQMYLRPLRMAYKYGPNFLGLEALGLKRIITNEKGVHYYVVFGIAVGQTYWTLEQERSVLAGIIKGVFYSVFGTISIVENVFMIWIPGKIIVAIALFLTWFMPALAHTVLDIIDVIDLIISSTPYGEIIFSILALVFLVYMVGRCFSRRRN